jgi:hypothetical protein
MLFTREQGEMEETYASIVALLSLPKIRLSEFVVSLKPTTSGFLVVPEIYSVALYSGHYVRGFSGEHGYPHVVVKVEVGCVKMCDGKGAVWVVQLWHNIREWSMLYAAERVAEGPKIR